MRPGLGVGVMILKDNKVLLGLRNPDKVKASSELREKVHGLCPVVKLSSWKS